MSDRYHIYSICALLAMGSLSAADSGNSASQKNSKTQNANKAAPLFLQQCPDEWRLSADFLYFLPAVDDTYFAVNSPVVGDAELGGTRSNNDFSFTPGFRVGAEYAFCKSGRDIQAFYTYLSAGQNRTVSGTDLWATVGSSATVSDFLDFAGSASSKLKLFYQRLDVNLSQHVIDAHGFNLYVQPGLEYAYIRLKQNYIFDITGVSIGTVYQQSKSWGIGPQLGLGFDGNLYSVSSQCGTTTHAIVGSGLFSSSILTGPGRIQEQDFNGTLVDNDVIDESTWRMIPAIHARAGLTYLCHTPSVGVSLSIGYELDTYIRALAKMVFVSTSATSNTVTNYYNFDVQGLDISLAFTF